MFCFQVWHWKLDSNLPGRLGQIGDWLYRAEELVDSELKYPEAPEEKANMLRAKVDEHKVCTDVLNTCSKSWVEYCGTHYNTSPL